MMLTPALQLSSFEVLILQSLGNKQREVLNMARTCRTYHGLRIILLQGAGGFLTCHACHQNFY